MRLRACALKLRHGSPQPAKIGKVGRIGAEGAANLPDFAGNFDRIKRKFSFPRSFQADMPSNLDKTDHRILQELQANGRLTHQELSERIGLSPSPCARRIKKLEQDGYITGYSARINEAKMGFGFNVFVSVGSTAKLMTDC